MIVIKMLVFVYGSLRSGLYNNYLLATDKYVGEFRTTQKYTMIGLKSRAFPFLLPEKIEGIPWLPTRGEVYEVSQETLDRLDSLEGHPNWYTRERVVVQSCDTAENLEAFVYLMKDAECVRAITVGVGEGMLYVSVQTVGEEYDWKAFLDANQS
jgi:gamma-glutamylaminecyclotransferase